MLCSDYRRAFFLNGGSGHMEISGLVAAAPCAKIHPTVVFLILRRVHLCSEYVVGHCLRRKDGEFLDVLIWILEAFCVSVTKDRR